MVRRQAASRSGAIEAPAAELPGASGRIQAQKPAYSGCNLDKRSILRRGGGAENATRVVRVTLEPLDVKMQPLARQQPLQIDDVDQGDGTAWVLQEGVHEEVRARIAAVRTYGNARASHEADSPRHHFGVESPMALPM